MKKFNIFSILRRGKLFLLALATWFSMSTSWAQTETTEFVPLGFTATESGTTTVKLNKNGSPNNIRLQYRINEAATWTNYTIGNSISLSNGNKVEFKATDTNSTFSQSFSFHEATGNKVDEDKIEGNYYYFSFDKAVEASGNVSSLLKSDGKISSVPEYAFVGLFQNCDKLLSAPILPDKDVILNRYCYTGMFFQCTNLHSAPELPRETLAESCYAYMFAGCEKLSSIKIGFKEWHPTATYKWVVTTKKRVKKTVLIFFSTWITSINHLFSATGGTIYKEDILPFTTGESYIPEGWIVPTDKDYLLFSWNSKIAETSDWDAILAVVANFFNNLFGWGSDDDEPEPISVTIKLNFSPAKNWTDTNDKDVFAQRRKLEYSYTGLATDWHDFDYLNANKNGLSLNFGQSLLIRAKGSNRKFSESDKKYLYFSITPNSTANSSLADFDDGIICVTGNIMSLLDKNCTYNEVPAYGFYNLFKDVDCIFNAPTLPATDLNAHCYEGMFQGCSKLNAAPNLPATTEQLEENYAVDCYKNMFNGCESLRYMNVGFDTWEMTKYEAPAIEGQQVIKKDFKITDDWVKDAGTKTTNGTFRCKKGLSIEYGDSRIPTNWSQDGNVGAVEENKDWLCFELTDDDGTVRLNRVGDITTLSGKLEYSIEDGADGTWKDYSWSGNFGKEVILNAKEGIHRVYFRSKVTDNSGKCSTGSSQYYKFKLEGNYNVSGNIMSLLHRDCNRFDVSAWEFYYLFGDCSSIRTAPTFPATTIALACYYRTFENCTALISPTELPAENLKLSCYFKMFYGCSSMTSAPTLPAITLAENCYREMFYGCTSLTTAPVLPAEQLVTSCYNGMFNGCTNLKSMDVYFTEWRDDLSATTNWVKDVANAGVFLCPSDIWNDVKDGDILSNEDKQKYFNANRIPKVFTLENDTVKEDYRWTVAVNANTCLYFEAARNGSSVQLNKIGTPHSVNLIYSIDNGQSWEDYVMTTPIVLNKGNRVYFKAGKTDDESYKTNSGFSKNGSNYYRFVLKGSVKAKGNIMSLLSQDNSATAVSDYTFYYLFGSNTALISAPTLPATTLGFACYYRMFEDCRYLITPPSELPATELKSACYKQMFMLCKNLQTTPKIQATKLAENCCQSMFENCTSITVAPTLPVATLEKECYKTMFKGCSSLKYINVGFKTWHANATDKWVDNGSSNNETYTFPAQGIFICPEELPHAENQGNFGTSRIPKADSIDQRWNVNVVALQFIANNNAIIALNKVGYPTNVELEYSSDNAISWHDYTFGEEIHIKEGENFFIRAKGNYTTFSKDANNYYQFKTIGSFSTEGSVMSLLNQKALGTTVPEWCFYNLFKDCDVKNVPTLPATTLGNYAYRSMFQNCSITEVDALIATTLGTGCYQSMFEGCVGLKKAPALKAETLSSNCYSRMFAGCTSLTEGPELQTTALASNCYNSMFLNCTNLRIAPNLPAKTLLNGCYANIFKGCSQLSEISVEFTAWDPDNATTDWVSGVADEGIFSCPTTLNTSYNFGTSRVPKDWDHPWVVNPDFLGFKATTDATIALNKVGTPHAAYLIYSIDSKSKWKDYSWDGQNGLTITLHAGQSVYFKAKEDYDPVETTNQYNLVPNKLSKDADNYYQFSITGTVAASGNTSYLLARTKNSQSVEAPAYGFYRLFKDCTSLTSIPTIPQNTKANAHSYESMFEGCSNVTSTPSTLPAVALGEACYKNMFKGCSSIVSCLDSLPDPDNVVAHCYEGMFEGCESLVKAPSFNTAKNPAVASHKAMFKGCKSLTQNLPTQLVNGGDAVKESCYESMFEGCESLNTKIDLPTNGLAKACYKALFKDCKSLTSNNLPELGFGNWAIQNGESAMESMFEGCESLTTPVVINVVETWSSYAKAIMRKMFKGCTNLTTPITLPLANIGEACFESMFEGCESLTKAPQLPQDDLAKDCYKRMFMGCTSLKRAPQLPAKTNQLCDSCYAYMFNGCTNLNYIDVAFDKWFDEPNTNFAGATYMWVENVAPTGTFMCPFELDKQYDESHIPQNWSADDNGDYLYIVNLENNYNNLRLSKVGTPHDINYQYSFDKKNWISYSTNPNDNQLLGNNSIVYIKCADGVLSKDANNYWKFSASGNIKIGGNITSLLDPTMEQTDVPDYAFYKLFSGCPHITDISELELPATELGDHAYASMFEGCTDLQNNCETALTLPAMTLGAYCYQNMFKDWKNLKAAPTLPATTLAEGCYSNMFNGCTKLKLVPALPATQLVDNCYESMFAGCSALDSLNVAFTTWSPASATTNWVSGVHGTENDYECHFVCPWDLTQNALDDHNGHISDVYGANLIPKDTENPWVILMSTGIDFSYATGDLTFSGLSPITYTSDASLSSTNRIGTTVDADQYTINLNDWLNAPSFNGLDSITYYAMAGTEMHNGRVKPTVNSITIYRHSKKIDMCICDTRKDIEDALYYANKVSSVTYPIKLFIGDGEYDFGNKTLVVGDYVSVIGESIDRTILKSSSEKGLLRIKGSNVYLQDMKLVNTGSGAAFTNNGQNTTMHIAMDGYYIEAPGGLESKRYSLPEVWNRATDPTQATIEKAFVNGSSISLESDARYFLVRINEKYSFADSKDFHIVESLTGKNIKVRAANSRGAFGEPITPTPITADGLAEYNGVTVKLNGYGFSTFCFDDPNITGLRVIGASVYKGIYREGTIYVQRLNDYDIVPRQTGVILAGLQNSQVHFYADNTTLSYEDSHPYENLEAKSIGMSGNWSTETIVNNGWNYYVLYNESFRPLKKDGGTLKPNKAYFDLGNENNASSIRIIFGMWEEEEEEVVSGINYLPTAGNDSEYSYMLTGVRMKDAKGLVIQNNKVVLVK